MGERKEIKDFSTWIKKQIERARLVECRDFITLTQKGERNEGVRGASISIEYHLAIEAAKHIGMMSGCFTVPEPTSVILNLVALPSIRAKKNPAKGDPLPGPCVLTLIGRQSASARSVRTQLRSREAQTVDTNLVTTPWLPAWLPH